MGPKMPQKEVAGGLSRRQMLRRGVAVGTAAWTVPTVTAISLTPANAASPSGQPSEPPKPPTKPPEPPELPTDKPTSPPTDEPSRPPSGEQPTPPADHPTPRPTPSHGAPGDDDTTVGGGQLPDTGPGDVARTVALGGLLAAGGAAAVAATRRRTDDADATPEATA
ncbi:LPXTG cell wall anchor domain-containing protein [Jiangella asiatica]|uniref:LPXTG cell wall anchor domain-containing protein n=2 Tax=Jiangella asiatica TaxID=2530372 RepID=A0A4R5CK11_9ACTN|nr:LPXTG cell wall anchor domain-containing protein [Jiangella asiatica]